MFLNRQYQINTYTKQRGSMLVMALFVIVVMAMLGLAVVQLLNDSSKSTVYEVYGARAFNAANSGADRALADIFGPQVTGAVGCDNVSSSYSLPKTVIAGFSGCDLAIKCREFDVTETGFTHYRIESTATCQAADFITQRTVAIEARQRN
ncbi:MAG: hypothetical protein HRU23_10600 [Gammaproteobacteria bacterium]|nr:hypothetical protein [Gammaproteobacteria bacterium]